MSLEYVRSFYKVPAEIGRRVVVYGKAGIIAEDHGHYIGVNLDSDRPGNVGRYHPCDDVKYLGMGEVRELTRGDTTEAVSNGRL